MLLPTTLKGPTMSQAGTVTKSQVNQGLSEPPMFKLIYLNDNTTPMEFVIETLLDSFNYNEQTALEITQDIHESGSAVVAVLPYEIAEQKGIEITVSARSRDYPLQIKLEPESA